MIDQPIHFSPYLKSVIWGGDRIASYKGIATDQQQIGESWELSAVPGHVSVVDCGPLKGKSLTELIDEYGAELVGKPNYEKYGNRFPLLVKLIDARADLSVQVHPNDELAQKRHHCPGKTEMWHVIETIPDARIYAGLKEQITPDEYESRVADNTIMDVIAAYDSAPGDTFFLPAGRIHAIGAGNLLAEIQQTSDITYRIYDYDRRDKDGNPRELHTEQARDAIDYTVYPTYKSKPVGDDLANCKYFDVRKMNLSSEARKVSHDRDSFTIIMCLHGNAEVTYNIPSASSAVTESQFGTIKMAQGETLLFPATMTDIRATGTGEIITVQS